MSFAISFIFLCLIQNAHAYVSCAIWMKVDPCQEYRVMERPRIVFAGINENVSGAFNITSPKKFLLYIFITDIPMHRILL